MNNTATQTAAKAGWTEKQNALKGILTREGANWTFIGVIITVIIALVTLSASWGRIEQRLDYQDRDIRVLRERMDAVENRLSAVENRLGAIEIKLEAIESSLQAISNHLGVRVLK